MELSKIKLGKFVSYTSRKHTGRGKVTEIDTLSNGVWITVYDKTRDTVVRLRPGQIEK